MELFLTGPLSRFFPSGWMVFMNLKFSKVEDKAWDKLQPDRFKPDAIFTTFRAYSPKKDKYYSETTNQEFYVLFNNNTIGKARLIKKEYRWSYDLTEDEIKNDTFSHWNRKEFTDMLVSFYGYPRVFGFWLTFKVTKVGHLMKRLEEF